MCTSSIGQDITEAKKDRYRDYLGDLGISYIVPIAYGTNFLSDGYDVRNGFNLRALVFVNERLALGAQFNHFKGEVTDISKVGNIESTGISHYNVLSGYSLLDRNNKLRLVTGLGVGYATYVNRLGNSKFNDDGFSLVAFIECSYRLGKVLGIYLDIQNNVDFMSIDSAQGQNDFFKRARIYAPSVGIRFYVL